MSKTTPEEEQTKTNAAGQVNCRHCTPMTPQPLPSSLYENLDVDSTANSEHSARQSAIDTGTHNYGFVANPALSKVGNPHNIMSTT